MWIGIGIAALAIGIGVIIGLNKSKAIRQLMKEGRTIKRQITFVETAEIFTLSAGEYNRIIDTIKGMDFSGTGVAVESNKDKQAVLFKSNGWAAQLYRMETDGDKDIYCFNFTKWQTYRGIPQNHIQMNILLTELEKAFLRIDPGTKVENARLKTNTKTNFI